MTRAFGNEIHTVLVKRIIITVRFYIDTANVKFVGSKST